MSPRAAPWLAWSLAGFSVALFVASVPLYVLARSAHVPGGWGADLSLGGLFGHALSLVFPLVGALIASRRPNNTIGWLFLTVGLLWTLSGMLDYYSVYGVAQPNVVPFSVLVAGINTWLWVPSVGLLGTYLLLLLPEGRLPSRRWPPGVALWSGTRAGECGHCSQAWINPGSRGVRNPFGLEGVPWVIVAALAADLLFALCMLASALALVYFGGVVVLQSVFRALTGQESTIAIVASTLAIVALFVSLRRRGQSFVDRRFYRRKYDAAKTLASFSVRLREETDLGTLSDDLVRVVSETLQPAHASLWLRPEVPPRDEQADLP
jgi:hypothetical protein